jgi:23S rRNA (cytidine1920-2'-O)/16S rRNA (cytidine1409-2'-O)-methyltransferase
LTSQRIRLDVAVAQAAGVSRERAQALIMAGRVMVDGAPASKSGALVAADAHLDVDDDARFVSRGGAKLERALEAFAWSVEGLSCLDVGASTGGFTDCLLQRGARSVTAVDVGYGQLAWRLRGDPRVKVVERCNFRLADTAALGAPFEFACADVSFISLGKLASKFRETLLPGARLIALVKPQFEAGRAAVGKGGVVRERQTHIDAVAAVVDAFGAAGLDPVALTFSPIKGPAGNIEFLIGAIARGDDGKPSATPAFDIAGVVDAAHETLAP